MNSANSTSANLKAAFKAIDKANGEDPNSEMVLGHPIPKELLYGQRMSVCLDKFAPDSCEALQLAVRSQHIQRWKSLRSDYPEGRRGYKRWRRELAKFHAETTAKILLDIGYDQKTIRRVEVLLEKKNLSRDKEVQTLEDVVCLVFIEHYLEAFSHKHSTEKLVRIINKTWGKMSSQAHEIALKLPMRRPIKDLISKALSDEQ